MPANAGYEGEAHCAAIWLFALQHSADHRLCPYAAIDAGEVMKWVAIAPTVKKNRSYLPKFT